MENNSPKKKKAAAYPVVVAEINRGQDETLPDAIPLSVAVSKFNTPAQKDETVTVFDSNIPYTEQINVIPHEPSEDWKKSLDNDKKFIMQNEKNVASVTPSQGVL